MAPLDPQQLLKALNELLGPSGEILGPAEASRIASLMKDANKLVSKCIYVNILKVKTSKETLEKLLTAGGWDTLNDWLQETKEEENFPFLVEILKVYQLLPVTVDILKTNNAAKTIKQLCKSDHESVKTLAGNIFDAWMKKVKGNNNSDDKSKKKKDKSKEKDRESEKKDSKSSSSRSKSKDSKHSSDRDKKSESRKRERERDVEEENMDTSSNDSTQSDERLSVRQGSGLKLHIKLGGEKDRTAGKTEETEKKRASTVKRPPSKFRSTGLEEETVPAKLPKNADLSKPIPKRTGSDIKSDLPNKRSRPNMPPPLTVPPPVSVPGSTPPTTSPQSPGEMHGKIKITPAKPKSNHVMHESSGFMDSLETSSRSYGALKKKRRSSGSLQGSTPPSKGASTPTTPPSPVSPTTAVARTLPTVPSFYKDTQESETPPQEKTERSPSPTEQENGKPEEESKTDIKTTDIKTTDIKTESAEVNGLNSNPECSQSPSDSNSSSVKESKGLLTTGATMVKKKKKSVSWKEDHELKEVFFFEMDEEERVNVNRPKDFHLAQKQEMMADRRAFESSLRMKNDHMVEQITWYRPKVCKDYRSDIEYGKESKEKAVQKARESGVLQALFFHKNMVPDNPQEPDLESEEPTEPKPIPLDDVSGGEQFLYNYESHPQAVTGKPAVTSVPETSMNQMPPFSGAPPLSQAPPTMMSQQGTFHIPQGLQLPPDLAQILQQIQNTPSNPNDPVMSQVQKILNNLITGGVEQNYEDLHQIQQMIGLHMGMPPDGMMQGPGQGMVGPGMMGMPPQGMPPQGMPLGPRTGLLGNAPPGFMQRPMGPGPGMNRFGPPGQGNWGPQGNMNMGGPQMGPQGGNFGGRMRGPGPNMGRGGGRGGGGKRGGRDGGNYRVLCRHFASGKCRMGSNCTFLHPGVNGPPLDNNNMNMDQPANS